MGRRVDRRNIARVDGRERVELLQVELTTRCNFTCGFCAGRSMVQGDLSLATFDAALARFPNLRHLELQGEGEPLLNPAFFDIARRARARGVALSTITNGSLLTPEVNEQLLDLPLEQLLVSIESPTPETFRQIRGGKLEKVVANLEHLVAAKRRRAQKLPRIGLAVTVLRQTLGELDAIFALYRRLGLDGGVNVQALQRMDSYFTVYDDGMQAQLLTREDGEELRRRLGPYAAELRIARRHGFHAELLADWAPKTRTCPWIERGAFLTHDGALTACPFMKDASTAAIGRVTGDDAAELHRRHEGIRDALKRGETPALCRGCAIPATIDHAARAPTTVKSELVALGKRVRHRVRRSPLAPLWTRAEDLGERVEGARDRVEGTRRRLREVLGRR